MNKTFGKSEVFFDQINPFLLETQIQKIPLPSSTSSSSSSSNSVSCWNGVAVVAPPFEKSLELRGLPESLSAVFVFEWGLGASGAPTDDAAAASLGFDS
jgi:hypothetical protein